MSVLQGFSLFCLQDISYSLLAVISLRITWDTGRITNWKPLGGPNLPIYVVSRVSTSGTRQTFEQQILGACENLPPGSRNEFDTTDQVVTAVKSTPGAIGYVDVSSTSSLSTVLIDRQQVDLPNIQSNVYQFWAIERFYTKGASQGLAQALIGYITGGEGGIAKLFQKNNYYSHDVLSSSLITTHTNHNSNVNVSQC